jgi:RNA polymerase sigma-70 factor (ECF subfamily)
MDVPQQLIVDFNSRKEWAWKEIYDGFYGPLFLFAFKITQNTYEAEDAAQDSFMGIFVNGKQYTDGKHLKAALYITVKNKCFDIIRKRRSINTSITELQYLGETEESLEDVFEADVRIGLLEEGLFHAVDKLPARSREMIIRRYVHKSSSKEIADAMEVTVQTVDNTLANARKMLQGKLKDINLGDLMLIPVILKMIIDFIL